METLHDRPDVRAALRALDTEACQAFARLLSPRESVVLHGRFLGHPPRSWGSLGRAMGVAQERVRLMEAEIIRKFDAWKSTTSSKSLEAPARVRRSQGSTTNLD